MKSCVIVLAAFLCACTHRYQYFDFSQFELTHPKGRIRVWVTGSWKEVGGIPNTTQRTSPYTLVVRFDSQDPPGQPVAIRITGVSAGGVAVESEDISVESATKAEQLPSDFKSMISIVHGGLAVPHQPIRIDGQLTYRGETMKFSADLAPTHSWEMRNDTWDRLMSV